MTLDKKKIKVKDQKRNSSGIFVDSSIFYMITSNNHHRIDQSNKTKILRWRKNTLTWLIESRQDLITSTKAIFQAAVFSTWKQATCKIIKNLLRVKKQRYHPLVGLANGNIKSTKKFIFHLDCNLQNNQG